MMAIFPSTHSLNNCFCQLAGHAQHGPFGNSCLWSAHSATMSVIAMLPVKVELTNQV